MSKLICKVIILILALVISSVYAGAQSVLPDTAIIASVDNEPVVFREFMQQASRERSQVIRYFRITYGCEYTSDFWTQTFDGKSPSDILKKRTLDTLVKIKIQQIQAKKWGIMPDISYIGFLMMLEKENKKRLEAKNRNEVIYGPVQYTEEVYYNYIFTNMVNQLKSRLERDVFNISETNLKEIYDRDKDRKYLNGFYTKVLLINMMLGNTTEAGVEDSVRNSAGIALNEIRNCFLRNENCLETESEIFKGNKFVSFVTEEIIFNDSVYAPEEENTLLASVKKQIATMGIGECSKIAELPGNVFFFRVLEKKSLGYRSFESCKNTVRSDYIDELYAAYFDSLLLKTSVNLMQNKYDQIKF